MPVISADYLYFLGERSARKELADSCLERPCLEGNLFSLAANQRDGRFLPIPKRQCFENLNWAGVHTLFSQEDSEGMTPFQKLKGRTWQIALPSFRRNRGLSPPGEEQA